MNKIIVLLPLLFLLCCENSNNISNEVEEVNQCILNLKNGMIQGDRILLKNGTSTHLSYGHSSGEIEDQTSFINSIVTGIYDFETIDISHQSIDIIDDIAIVRHHLHIQERMNDQSIRDVYLKVLLVFKNDANNWTLIARQAVR